jgi:hypothetical protein
MLAKLVITHTYHKCYGYWPWPATILVPSQSLPWSSYLAFLFLSTRNTQAPQPHGALIDLKSKPYTKIGAHGPAENTNSSYCGVLPMVLEFLCEKATQMSDVAIPCICCQVTAAQSDCLCQLPMLPQAAANLHSSMHVAKTVGRVQDIFQLDKRQIEGREAAFSCYWVCCPLVSRRVIRMSHESCRRIDGSAVRPCISSWKWIAGINHE